MNGMTMTKKLIALAIISAFLGWAPFFPSFLLNDNSDEMEEKNAVTFDHIKSQSRKLLKTIKTKL